VTGGAATKAAVAGVSIGGKTGTAEFRQLGNGEWENHAWFTSFAPYESPEIIVTVYFELGWGGDKAAPVAGDIIDFIFDNLDLGGDELP
jgi:cell division protein FtsI/penicillin-binding protein 2